MSRTKYCGQITKKNIGETITLNGWVQKRRDLGGMIFIDLRDRTGLVQVVFNADEGNDLLQTAETLRAEHILEITGNVVERLEGAVNPNMATGEVEIEATELTVLNTSKTPPFEITDQINVSDDLRLKYRYIDLRRPRMQENIMIRHEVKKAIRHYLDDHGFIDIETPYLTKSTPEGARDYLVPSRVHQGKFFALPQSPQLFKQLLMSSGFDRYYQIVRCFRDEDLRGDRQPEFTQVDIETSFLSEEEIRENTEIMLKHVVKEVKGLEIKEAFPIITYDEAMNNYGSDKPDIRFEMKLKDVSSIVAKSDFRVFTSTIENGGSVKGLAVKGAADEFTRKQIDGLEEIAKVHGAKGLAWIKVTDKGLTGPISKFFAEEEMAKNLLDAMDAETGDLLLFVADKEKVTHDALGALRVHLGKELKLYDPEELAFIWVVDWPLLEFDEDENRYVAAHHPFTHPKPEDVDKLVTNPTEVYAQAYDIVLNGYEIGGGSIRIHEKELQEQMFEALGFTHKEAESQFGFLLNAFDYGFPPHGGIALGLDRLVMLLANEPNIREVIPFPKNGRAADPLTDAPAVVSDKQLQELALQVTKTPKKTDEKKDSE
ncbi:aspartyl-tRNA synthetase [Atopostipes suicloacalis DSM 15692]|uniref:Aspartate--tRNA(Asp/Asn) ligase n=1 Tax=Atopostipes suicloacalis DSM 15692 TaxID=1121025 RepID=A0A1M4TJR2_9LACT|nr:aspartate--tRNA ligase [Atopostipes suicloacalis]SHE44733.1 aspartyl-tRNA synthetase [Atopostipes suicloacalis DSM 15692]